MRFVISAILAAMLAGSAQAGDLPRFDVDAHCRAVASFGGTYSASIDKTCFDIEQEAYDALKAAWSAVPETTRLHCARVAGRGTTASYSIMKTCIEIEADAAAANGKRSFSY